MINYVMVGTKRFEEAVAFYEVLMAEMGATRAGLAGPGRQQVQFHLLPAEKPRLIHIFHGI